jgi:hypothetical protein
MITIFDCFFVSLQRKSLSSMPKTKPTPKNAAMQFTEEYMRLHLTVKDMVRSEVEKLINRQ